MTVLWVFFAVAGVERGLLFTGPLVTLDFKSVDKPARKRCALNKSLFCTRQAREACVRASGASALTTRLNGEGKEYDSGTTELRTLVKRTIQTNNYF